MCFVTAKRIDNLFVDKLLSLTLSFTFIRIRRICIAKTAMHMSGLYVLTLSNAETFHKCDVKYRRLIIREFIPLIKKLNSIIDAKKINLQKFKTSLSVIISEN